MLRIDEIPAFKIVDGDRDIKWFKEYNQLYRWCKERDEATLGAIIADPFVMFHFGECPMKYDRKTGELFVLGWQKVERKVNKE